MAERKSSWHWHDFGKLRTCDDLEDYLHGKGKGTEYEHTNYFYYSDLDTIDNILSSRKFWATSVINFNDSLDTKQFDSEKDYYFALCLSSGLSENLPMWFLYSGIDGKGGRIRITPGNIKTLIRDSKYTLVSGRGQDAKLICNLKPSENMEYEFRDILYFRKDNGKDKCSLKYNTMTNYEFSYEEFKRYDTKHKGFRKGLIWYYEKETRLLIHIIGNARKQLESFKSAEHNYQNIHVEISFPKQVMNHTSVCLAPNIRREEIETIIKEHTGLQELIKISYPVKPSNYAGTINFRFKNCSKSSDNPQK